MNWNVLYYVASFQSDLVFPVHVWRVRKSIIINECFFSVASLSMYCYNYFVHSYDDCIGEFLSYFGTQEMNDGRNQEQPYDDQHDRN